MKVWIRWNDQSIRWFENASEYTGYNKKLAELLLKYIPERGTLCDMGCGAGLIDYELSPYFEQITCVDISPEAIQAVENGAKKRGIRNITTICEDGSAVEGQWDTVIALFHGGVDAYTTYFPMVKDRLILVTHGEAIGSFGPKERKLKKCFDVVGFQERMDELGVRYELEFTALEYGQPFETREEAESFVGAYTMPMEQPEMDAYLAAHMQETGDEKFPYYIPNEKKLGIFVIRREDNENI